MSIWCRKKFNPYSPMSRYPDNTHLVPQLRCTGCHRKTNDALPYDLEKADLDAPQTGQTQSSGMSSKAVPGTTSLAGSPTDGSYSYRHTSHVYFSKGTSIFANLCICLTISKTYLGSGIRYRHPLPLQFHFVGLSLGSINTGAINQKTRENQRSVKR
jgi:hypothetical protein